MHAVWLQTAWCHSSFTAGGLGEIWFLSFRNHVLEKSDRCGSEHYGLYPGASLVGGERVAECIGPYWPPGTPGFIRNRQYKLLDPFRCDTELLYSRVIWERLVMLAENSHDNEVYWKTLIDLSIQHHSNLTWSY